MKKTLTTILLLMTSLAVGLAVGWYARGPRAPDASAATTQPKKQTWTCGMHPQVISDRPGNCPICGMALEPARDDGAPAGNAAAVGIDPVIIQNMGVRVARVNEGPVRRQIRATGNLRWAQNNIRDVNLRVSGWVETLYAHTEGMHVEKDQPLFELYSPEIQIAIEELIAARRASENSAPMDDPQSRDMADTLVETSRRKLERWGLAASQIDEFLRLDAAPRTVTFLSPAGGDVTEKMIVAGAAVMSGQRALQIVDRSTLWLNARIFPMDLPFIHIDQSVSARIEGFNERVTGRVVFIDPAIDPQTRTASVRVELPNPQLHMRPGMFATVDISAQLVDRALLVPREAVIDTGLRQIVFVAMDEPGHFEPRDVTLGEAAEQGAVRVLSGLSPDDTVVVSGQFLIDSESRMIEARRKHEMKSLADVPRPIEAAP